MSRTRCSATAKSAKHRHRSGGISCHVAILQGILVVFFLDFSSEDSFDWSGASGAHGEFIHLGSNGGNLAGTSRGIDVGIGPVAFSLSFSVHSSPFLLVSRVA